LFSIKDILVIKKERGVYLLIKVGLNIKSQYLILINQLIRMLVNWLSWFWKTNFSFFLISKKLWVGIRLSNKQANQPNLNINIKVEMRVNDLNFFSFFLKDK